MRDRIPHRGPASCGVEGCSNALSALGYCESHYRRFKTHGDPLGGGTVRGEVIRYLENVVLNHDGDDCLFWPYARRQNGYPKIKLDGEHSAHRVVCARVHGKAPSKEHQAAHSCGNGHLGCVSPKHLSWKTPAGNAADRADHGTQKRGGESHLAKITASDVLEIRALKGKPLGEISSRFGISRSQVSLIQLGKSWSWLETDIEYRGYIIRYEYCLGYAWHHRDYDVDDKRHGFSRTLDEAKADIDEQIEEMADAL